MNRPSAARLSVARLPPLGGVDTPTYDRASEPSIVHLGVGAFARAHLCTYADDLLRQGHDTTVHGISLRSDRARAELEPQDGLFTLLEREPGARRAPRVVGSLTAVDTGAAAAIAAIARPATRMVTMTVTEKGYETPDPEAAGSSAVGVLVAGLEARRDARLPAPVIASLDNLADNGHVLRSSVVALATAQDPSLGAWIAEQVSFPRSVVDRMVPATSPADLDEAAQRLGLEDLAVVVAERHRSWAIDHVNTLLPLDEVGVEVVADVGAHQVRKLWLLNGPHSAFAYAGLLTGCVTIAQATEHPVVGPFVQRLVDDVLEVAPGGAETAGFAAESLRRFRNPDLGHTCLQVGADGSRKLPQRLLPIVALRQARGLDTRRAATVVAAWLTAVDRLQDPEHERLVRASTDLDRLAVAWEAMAPVGLDPVFADEIAAMMGRLRDDGPAAWEATP